MEAKWAPHRETSPVFLMSSAPPMQEALVGGLWSAWFSILDDKLTRGKGGSTTLQELFVAAEGRYLRDNVYDVMNSISWRCGLDDETRCWGRRTHKL